jgi:transcriptional regulator with XRE-family HTH domain
MDSNEALRRQVHRLLAAGVTQKKIAEKLGLSTTKASRWIRREKRAKALDLKAWDGMRLYVHEMKLLMAEIERELHQMPAPDLPLSSAKEQKQFNNPFPQERRRRSASDRYSKGKTARSQTRPHHTA